ncbi:MAG: hypothetical protein HKO65_11740 [Gemmatimonadetes bacterium]|nr:glycosyltransferase family 39 protein [Gemmatimonadota bacterium]NNM05750.1 hypothetical protein [Gemmatimonadota bacterium]
MFSPRRIMVFSLVLGGALRSYGLGSESLWVDESSTARRMGLSFVELFFDMGSSSQTPLYFWISKAWCTLAGMGEIALRTPALIFGVALIPAVFVLGRELIDRNVGAWGSFLTAINPYLIHYSQEARPYSLLALLSVVSWWLLIRWMRSGRSADLVLFLTATIGVLYTHPFGILILPTHLAVLLLVYPEVRERLTESDLRWLLRGMELSGLLYLPLLYRMALGFRGKLSGGSVAAWIPDPAWLAPVHTFERYFMNQELTLSVLVLCAIALVQGIRRGGGTRRLLLLAISAWMAFAWLPWLVSKTLSPVYFHRYTMPFLPLVTLLAGSALARMPNWGRRASVLVILALSFSPLYRYHTLYDKAPVREVFRAIHERLDPGDVVILDTVWTNHLLTYYLPLPEGATQVRPRSLRDLDGPLANAKEIWLITWEEGDVGVEDYFLSERTSDWTLRSRQALSESPLRNPRAFTFQRITISQFSKTPTAPSPQPVSVPEDHFDRSLEE